MKQEPEPTVEANRGGTPISPQPKESRVQPTWRKQGKGPASCQPIRLISHTKTRPLYHRADKDRSQISRVWFLQCSVRPFRKVHQGGQHLERLTIKERCQTFPQTSRVRVDAQAGQQLPHGLRIVLGHHPDAVPWGREGPDEVHTETGLMTQLLEILWR